MQEIAALAAVGLLPARAPEVGPSQIRIKNESRQNQKKLFCAVSLLLNSAGIILMILLLAGEHDLAGSLASIDIWTAAFFSGMFIVFAAHIASSVAPARWKDHPLVRLAHCTACSIGLGLAFALPALDLHAFKIAFSVGGQALAAYEFAAFYSVSLVVLAGAIAVIIKNASHEGRDASAG